MKKITLLAMFAVLFSVDYETEIQPIFDNNCGNCHLGNSSGGLNLSNYQNLMSGSDDGAVVIPGNHEQSILWDEINSGDMPQGNNPELSDEEIDLIAQWIDEGALPEESNDVLGCMDPNAITCEELLNSPVCTDMNNVNDCLSSMDCLWDSVGESCSGGFTVYFPDCDTCSDDDPCDNYYNPNATEDNGLCMYNEVPESHEFSITVEDTGLYLDWSVFTPPVALNQYVLMRCLDADGDTDGDGYLEYENCYFILNPGANYQDTQFLDEFDSEFVYNLDETAGIKYTLSLFYPNNNYWGSAFGNYYYEPSSILMGDLNFDGIINVIDVVSLVNGILGGELTDDQQLPEVWKHLFG